MPSTLARRLPVAGIVGLVLSLLGCGDPAGSGVARVERREWMSPVKTEGIQLITEHYDIRTTVKDEVLCEYLPTFMEGCFAEYRKLMPLPGGAVQRVHRAEDGPARQGADRDKDDADRRGADRDKDDPDRRGAEDDLARRDDDAGPETQPASDSPNLIMYVFGRRVEWAAFTKGFVPNQAETYLHIHSGGYMDHRTATAVMFDLGRDHTLSLMAHEGWHQYLARYFPRPVPAWLNEGLATQFEDFDLDGARPIFRPTRNLTRKNTLREALALPDGLTKMPHLLAMNAGEAVTKTGQPARGYYAQVWATVAFLRNSPKYRRSFARLLADAGTDRLRTNISAYRAATPSAAELSDGEIAFRHYITEDLDGFDAECRAYARDLVQ